jgi:hypothetical protein
MIYMQNLLRISVTGNDDMTSGVFSQKSERFEEALVALLSTVFILFGSSASLRSAGPIMIWSADSH